MFSVLGLSRGLLFILVHQLLFGFCMGLVFAPNHKGMPMIEKGVRVDFLHRQVITARNITPGWITDWCFGGLNYQIEHHLFPSMPRNRLPKARVLVKTFCKERPISNALPGEGIRDSCSVRKAGCFDFVDAAAFATATAHPLLAWWGYLST